jgi:hypothetical protein
MKDTFVLVFVSILFFACTGPTVAQEIKLIPELKEWEPLLGKWTSEMEFRESPDGAWEKESESFEVHSGGFFVEFSVTDQIGGEKTSLIEIVGYDPLKNTCVSSFFGSDGSRGTATSIGWSGTTQTANFTTVTAEREVQVNRSVWEYSSDFKSAAGTIEQFNDGKWWVVAKFKDTKVD